MRHLTDEEITYRFAARRAVRDRRARRMGLRIWKTLSAGKIVEEIGVGESVQWSLDMYNPPFIKACMNAAYLARHLYNRHVGFGTTLEFYSGICNACGYRLDMQGFCTAPLSVAD